MGKIILLAIGTFALGVDAFIIAGLIPAISSETNTSQAYTGQMVTIFTLCYALSGPVLSSLLKLDAKSLLVGSLIVFTLGNVGTALSDSFVTLVISRAIAGTGAGLYSPTAAATAAHLAPVNLRGRALSTILGGLSVGTVIGVPTGLLVADSFGWRSSFWFLSVVGILACLGILKFVPRIHLSGAPSIKARLSTFVDLRVAPIVLVSLIFNVASLGLYTYIAPILQSTSGITNIALYLWIWGIGGIIGAFSVGSLIDRTSSATRVMPVVLLVFMVATASISFGGQTLWIVILAMALWGASGFASPPPQQHLLLERAPDRGTVGVAANSSAIYLGGAFGTLLGGVALHHGVHLEDLPKFASGISLFALIIYIFLVIRWGSRPSGGANKDKRDRKDGASRYRSEPASSNSDLI